MALLQCLTTVLTILGGLSALMPTLVCDNQRLYYPCGFAALVIVAFGSIIAFGVIPSWYAGLSR